MALAANAKKVYAKATAGAPSAGDLLDGVIDASVSETRDMGDTSDYLGDEFRSRIALMRDASISLSGQVELSDSPQNLIRSHHRAGTTLYITILDNGTNGFTYPVLVESYEASGAVDGVVEFSASCVGNGAPVAV